MSRRLPAWYRVVLAVPTPWLGTRLLALKMVPLAVYGLGDGWAETVRAALRAPHRFGERVAGRIDEIFPEERA